MIIKDILHHICATKSEKFEEILRKIEKGTVERFSKSLKLLAFW